MSNNTKQIYVISVFPEIVENFIKYGVLKRSQDKDLLKINMINLRDFSKNKGQIDDKPYGGGAGMVMMAKPLFEAIDHATELVGGTENLRVIYPSPQGELWSHKHAVENSKVDKLIVICGHYKGIDQRVIEKYVTHEYSIGDFVVTSGELPAMIVIDSVVRLIPGVLNKIESALSDTFSSDLLDAPHYTQPREIEGLKVPDVLMSGHHEKIKKWRKSFII